MGNLEGMIISDLFNESSTVGDALIQIGKLGKWIQAIGFFIILWILFQLVNLYINRKKKREIFKLREDVKKLEKKIDQLIKRKK